MVKITRKSGAERRVEIAEAILRIIGEKGLTAVTTATVSAAVGVSSGALFRHFDTLEDMLQAAVTAAIGEIEQTFPVHGLPPLERIIELARSRVQLFDAQPGIAWLLKSDQAYLELPPDAARHLRGMAGRTRAFLLAALREGAGQGGIRDDIAPEVLMVTVIGTIHSLAGRSVTSPSGPTPFNQVTPDMEQVLAGLATLLTPLITHETRTTTTSRPQRRGNPMTVTSDTPIGKIAAEYPLVTRVFARHQLDFCCGGGRPLGEVCAAKKLDVATILQEIQVEMEVRTNDVRWDDAPLGDLVDHILVTFHVPLKEELPRLDGMARKVLDVHHDKDPERLEEVATIVTRLREDLLNHMEMEEDILFPMIMQESAYMAQGPIEVMQEEHEVAGDMLRRLRKLTSDYVAPPEACNTWRALWHGLGALESDLHQHIHLENNILFPRVLGRE